MNNEELLLNKISKFLFENNFCIARPGMYDLDEALFKTGVLYYLQSGENVFPELDKITLRSYEKPDYMRNQWALNEDEIKFWEDELNKKGFWDIYTFLTPDEINDLTETIIASKEHWQHLESYKYQRRFGVTLEKRQAVIDKQNGNCKKCNRSEPLEIDHIKPLINGGNSELENLQGLCKSCHRAKTQKERSGYGKKTND